MGISGKLQDLYIVGEKMLPEMGNCFAEAANMVHGSHKQDDIGDSEREVRNPAVETRTTVSSAAFDSWMVLRDEVQKILKLNAENLQGAGEAIVAAADDYAKQDGYNSEDIQKAKEKADGPSDLTSSRAPDDPLKE